MEREPRRAAVAYNRNRSIAISLTYGASGDSATQSDCDAGPMTPKLVTRQRLLWPPTWASLETQVRGGGAGRCCGSTRGDRRKQWQGCYLRILLTDEEADQTPRTGVKAGGGAAVLGSVAAQTHGRCIRVLGARTTTALCASSRRKQRYKTPLI